MRRPHPQQGNRRYAEEDGVSLTEDRRTRPPQREDPRELRLWTEERRGAVILLAFLADRDASLLRRAALEVAGEWVDPVTRDLLLDATQECR